MKFLNTLLDPFIIGLLAMLGLAWIFPFDTALHSTYFPLKDIIYWGIFGVFFLYGAKLDLRQLSTDIGNWKLHLSVQASTFILFPLIVLTIYPFAHGTDYEQLWLACFFLAALPSTVSSAVVMVAIAKGNLPAAIVNASLSGLIGLFATPLWMGIFLSKSSESLDFSTLTQQLFLQLLLPVIIGLFANRYIRSFILTHAKSFGWFDKTIIFLIIYKSFSAAFLDGIFQSVSAATLTGLFIFSILLFLLIFTLLRHGTKALGFNFNDQKTIVLCGVQKSLVHASVFVTLIIPDLALQSLFLLPIMIYHSLQLFYTSYIAKKWGDAPQETLSQS